MPKDEDILVSNLQETLQVIQRYLLLGLTSSLFLFVLALTNPNVTDQEGKIKDPISGLEVPAVLAGLLAMALYWIAGVLVILFTKSARRIVVRLMETNSEIIEAALTYPSLLTLGRGPRLFSAMFPTLLGIAAYCIFYLPSEGVKTTLYGASVFALPYIVLAIIVWRPFRN